MSRTAKSQWDFGELFPSQELRKVFSVSDLTQKIRRLLEQQVGQVWVSGEITNFRIQGSGHAYFTLKDSEAQLSCVLFRGETQVDRAQLQDGRKVILSGELTVYEPRGQYQLRVIAVELQGIGALQVAFEKLKQKLNAEGLFAPERKRPLPRYAQRLGLVTSPTGAALHDVLHVIERRNPSLEIFLAPCRVQGVGAAQEIAAAIRLLDEFNRTRTTLAEQATPQLPGAPGCEAPAPGSVGRPYLDLILVTRGGGSLEDLWAFNEEVVARAIFESGLPVVSAVGHEIDFTISDFVADVRAATPSAAAEIITEGVFSSSQFLAEARGRMSQLVGQWLEDKENLCLRLSQRLVRAHPRRRLDERLQRLDDLQSSLRRCLRQAMRQLRSSHASLAERLVRLRPAALLQLKSSAFLQATRRLDTVARYGMEKRQRRLSALNDRLRLLGPEQVLARGYSITTDHATGRVLRTAAEVRDGQWLRTRLRNGQVISRVQPEGSPEKPSHGKSRVDPRA